MTRANNTTDCNAQLLTNIRKYIRQNEDTLREEAKKTLPFSELSKLIQQLTPADKESPLMPEYSQVAITTTHDKKYQPALTSNQDKNKEKEEEKALYAAVYHEIIAFETEIRLLNTIFEEKRKQARLSQEEKELLDKVALMLFYSSAVAKQFFHTYRHQELVKHYQQIHQNAHDYFNETHTTQTIATLTLLGWITKHAKEQGSQLIELFIRISKFESAVSELNVNRIYWIFCHLTVNQSIQLAEQIKVVNRSHGEHLIHDLNDLNPVTNALSVAFYAIRFLIEITLIAKHCFANDEKQVKQSERFWHEFNQRKLQLLNDLVWGIANLVTNYHELFGIGVPLANQLTAALLVFDVLLAKLKYKQEENRFEKEKKLIETEQTQLETEAKALTTDNVSKDEVLLKRLKNEQQLLENKLKLLEQEWKIKRMVLTINTDSAWALLGSFCSSIAPHLAQLLSSGLIGPAMPFIALAGMAFACYKIGQHNKALGVGTFAAFLAAFILCPPIALLINSMVGISAVALYMSNQELINYQQAKLAYQNLLNSEAFQPIVETLAKQGNNHPTYTDIKRALKELDIANKDELLTKLDPLYQAQQTSYKVLRNALLERAIMPSLIILAFAINWPVGIGLVVTYTLFKISRAYLNHKKQPENIPTHLGFFGRETEHQNSAINESEKIVTHELAPNNNGNECI